MSHITILVAFTTVPAASDESTLKKQLPIVSSNLTSSKTKNSFSGPKYAVSAIPESDKYFSAFFAMPRGSFS